MSLPRNTWFPGQTTQPDLDPNTPIEWKRDPAKTTIPSQVIVHPSTVGGLAWSAGFVGEWQIIGDPLPPESFAITDGQFHHYDRKLTRKDFPEETWSGYKITYFLMSSRNFDHDVPPSVPATCHWYNASEMATWSEADVRSVYWLAIKKTDAKIAKVIRTDPYSQWYRFESESNQRPVDLDETQKIWLVFHDGSSMVGKAKDVDDWAQVNTWTYLDSRTLIV